MKIVVLCGGLSPERNVSISSGTKVAMALQSLGHKVVLVDMFFGLEDYDGPIDKIFDNPPPLGDTKIDEDAPDLRKSGAPQAEKQKHVRAGVLRSAPWRTWCSGLHGTCGRTAGSGRFRPRIPYTGSGHLGSAIAMNKD